MRALLALALLVAASAPLVAGSSSAPCEGYADVPMQGPSCLVDGGWRVLLPDGSSVLTHGVDRAPSGGSGMSDYTDRLMPACVADATTDPHVLLVYAYPPQSVSPFPQSPPSVPPGNIILPMPKDLVPRVVTYNGSASRAPELRDMVNRSNGWLDAQATALSAHAGYVFACDAPDTISISTVELKTPNTVASFQTIVSELRQAGYTSHVTKYWVYYEGTTNEAAGISEVPNDDRLAADNAANTGGQFSVTLGVTGTWGVHVMLHEGMHGMGAVQLSAPHTTGSHHCNDGWDLMCYADGGSSEHYTTTACAAEVLDCGGDDYFAPSPAAGSYLDTHWNLASTFHVYMTHT